jgi:hypothetical protein
MTMTATDELLRETFDRQADLVTMPSHLRGGIDGRARRYRARRVAAIATGAVAALAVGIGVPMATRDTGVAYVPSSTGLSAAASPVSYDTWQPRGGLAHDSAFIASALATWDGDATSQSPAPHVVINVLWAGTFRTGRAAVLLGSDSTGARRIAVIASTGRTLHVIRDVSAPVALRHLSFNLFTDGSGPEGTPYRDALVVLTPPDSGWTVQWAGGADPSQGTGSVTTDDGIALINIDQSGPQGNPTIRIVDADTVVYAGPIGSLS